MIDYIKYMINDKTYTLTNHGDGTWSRDEDAPSVAGNYLLTFTISENGSITTIDSSNSLYESYLQLIIDTERNVYLENLVPDFIAENEEFTTIFDIENDVMDKLHASMERMKADAFITTASDDGIKRREAFIGIKGSGTLNQRKSYLISLMRKGNKLNKSVIKGIANAITGSDCNITFFGAEEADNPVPGCGLLNVKVLSPDNSKDYKYDDIARALKPLVPAHIRLIVSKYFALWEDVNDNFADWSAISTMTDWQTVKDYIPPLQG